MEDGQRDPNDFGSAFPHPPNFYTGYTPDKHGVVREWLSMARNGDKDGLANLRARTKVDQLPPEPPADDGTWEVFGEVKGGQDDTSLAPLSAFGIHQLYEDTPEKPSEWYVRENGQL